MQDIEYKEEGVVSETISAMISLFIGIGVIVMVIILVGVIGGKAYSTTQTDVQAIAVDTNTLYADRNGTTGGEIVQDINSSILSAFSGLGDAAGFLGIIILALVFFLVLILLATGMQPFGGGNSSL